MRRSTELAFLLFLAVPVSGHAEDAVQPGCFGALGAFAQSRGAPFDRATATFGPRWGGGGHEFSRVPGMRVRIPVPSCNGALVLDVAPNCHIVKSWGENGCKQRFPREIH